MFNPKIAIIGAGPAGLTLARLLQQNNIQCTVYEADKDRHSRNQGGSLDLHAQGGQRALKAAGLFEEFQKQSRPESQVLKLLRYDGKVLWDENVTGSIRPLEYDDRPEIDRIKLRDILLDSVEPNRIKWDHKVSDIHADPEAKNKYTILLANGDKESGIDLVVGADGAWSKVRPLITDVQPYYSGVTGIEVLARDVSKSNPWLARHIGAGNCYMFDEGRAVQSQVNGDDIIRTYAYVRREETWKDECGIDWSDHTSARQEMVKRFFHDCSDDIGRTVLESRDGCVMRQLWMLPIGLRWETRPGVTLIGDAAHLMTPFAGVGVNLAMVDALHLAEQLIARKETVTAKLSSDSSNIEAAIRSYETEMFERAEQNAQKTYKGLQGHFSKDGGEPRANMLKAYYEAHIAKERARAKCAGSNVT